MATKDYGEVTTPVVFPYSEWTKVSEGLPEVDEWGDTGQLYVQWAEPEKHMRPVTLCDRFTSDYLGKGPRWVFECTTCPVDVVLAYAPYHAPEPPVWE